MARVNEVRVEGWINSNIRTHYNNQLGFFYLYFGKKTNGVYKTIKIVFLEKLFDFATSLKKGDYIFVEGYLDFVENNNVKEINVVATKIDLLKEANE